ncbi:MAG: VOC family protein [Anaerolineales bacterium]|nr:VOC family protein [Anaerolineales bacterium]
MPKINRISHIAIVVDDIDQALAFWRDALGLQLDHVEEVPEQQSIVALLPTGESEIELVQPTSDDTGVARYLHKRGPGMHHI